MVRFALHRYGSVDAALTSFEDWQRSRERFCDVAWEWGLVTRRVVWAYPATQLLVTELQTMHDDDIHEPSLVDLVKLLYAQHPVFTVELFLRGTDLPTVTAKTIGSREELDAQLVEIRERGYAIDEEQVEGMRCVSATGAWQRRPRVWRGQRLWTQDQDGRRPHPQHALGEGAQRRERARSEP